MDSATFLIKCAVNTQALATIAKSNGIPLIGDWRYAAKLLHKAKSATPAGQEHFRKVLGFSSQPERSFIQRAYANMPSANHAKTEVGIHNPTGSNRAELMIGPANSETVPISKPLGRRFVHTHPGEVDHDNYHRSGPLGLVCPGSHLDGGSFGGSLEKAIQEMKTDKKLFGGDMTVFKNNPRTTQNIVSPVAGSESVTKMKDGDWPSVRRLYFKQGTPL